MRSTPLLIAMLAAGGLLGSPAAIVAQNDGPGLGEVRVDRAHDRLMRIVMNRRARLGIKVNLQARTTDSIGAPRPVTPVGAAACSSSGRKFSKYFRQPSSNDSGSC